MKASDFSILAAGILSFTLISSMHAQQSPAERVAEIQVALREAKLDGWLFYDFRHSDPLAYRILKLDEKMFASRRWFYYVPASGEPVKIVQSIEQFTHRIGHSIGEETHGNGVNIDDFETRDSRRIIPDVCFSIEPGIYLEGKFGVRSEINVYVSDKDIEVTGQPIQTEIIPILKTR